MRVLTIALLLLAVACGNSIPAQEPTRTASPLPLTYVALGASDVAGIGATNPLEQSWPAYIARELTPGSSYINLGQPGATVTRIRQGQMESAIAARPDIITLWVGVNDMTIGTFTLAQTARFQYYPPPRTLPAPLSAAQFSADLTELFAPLLARTGATILIATIPDLTSVPWFSYISKEELLGTTSAYNQVLRTLATQNKRIILVDLEGAFLRQYHPSLVSPDGFHPNEQGYALLAQEFLREMRGRKLLP